MTIDRIDWHWDAITEDIPEDEHWERSGAHIGYFLEWAYKKGFAPTNLETHNIDEYKKVVNSEKTGIQFLIENCDTKLWEENLNDQGQKFTAFAYSAYLDNLETILDHKPYTEKYNQQDLQNVSKYLDAVYSDYLANPQLEFAKKEKQPFLQKVRDLFS